MHPPTSPPDPNAFDEVPHIAVLVGLHNGAAHLDEQLQSFCDQTLRPTWVIASDDGSTDDSVAKFDAFGRSDQTGIQWRSSSGPQQGSCANYMALLSEPGPETDYIALSDQDDIWLPDKLARAITRLGVIKDRPALFGARSWEWHSTTDDRALSRPVPPPYEFAHALVQNFAGGNTMVLNRKAIDLVQACLPDLPTPAVHDWWLYQLISGAGGTVLLDDEPQLLYRQHQRNQIGANSSLRSKMRRTGAMLSGTYRQWNDANCAALMSCRAHLTRDARAILERFVQDRHGTLPARLSMMRDTKLYRKGWANQKMLWLAAALNKL